MKNLIVLVLMLVLLLCGCSDRKLPSLPQEDAQGSEEAVVTAEIVPQEPEEAQSYLDIDPRDEFMNYGYTHFKSEKDCTYFLKAENSPELEWRVYILDKEFEDAERYIPQAYEEVFQGVGDVEAEIEAGAGQWVYIYCGANGWTGIEVPEGAHMSVSF